MTDVDETSSFDIISSLEVLWNNFLYAKDETEKEHWLYIFLYTYQTQPSSFKTSSESFLNSIPSELFSYFLELVSSIITVSLNGNSDSTYHNEASDCKNISQFVLETEDDITTVTALREFLTHGLGKNILDFFKKCDIESITCKRELVCLLLNLFPNTPWNTGNDHIMIKYQIENSVSIDQQLDNFLLSYLCSTPKKSRLSLCTDTSRLSDTTNSDINLQKSPSANNATHSSTFSIDIDNENFKNFKATNKSSDEIAFILIEVLLKLVENERNEYLSEKSITVKCMDFVLKTLNSVDVALLDTSNVYDVKNQLLIMLTLCLNNLFAKHENFIHLKESKIFTKLAEYISDNSNAEDINRNEHNLTFLYRLLYFMFTLLNNCLIMSSEKADTFNTIYETIKNKSLINNMRNMKSLDPKYNVNFRKILNVLLKIIQYLKILECNNFQEKKHKRKSDDKILVTYQQMHHKNFKLSCVLEKHLIEMFNELNMINQKLIAQHFQKCGICCCSCSINTLKLFLYETIQFKKLIYTFCERIILRTIFMKSALCVSCLGKSKSIEFSNELLDFYINKKQSLNDSEEKTYFFKHLLNASSIVSNSITLKLIYKIVLPSFYNEQVKDMSELNINVILICLNMILTNLTDKRLIRDFFVENNINYLQKLIHVPELSRAVCSLLKVGVDKLTHLESNEYSDNRYDMIHSLIHIHLEAVEKIVRVFLEKVETFLRILDNSTSYLVNNNQSIISDNESSLNFGKCEKKIANTTEVLYLTTQHLKLCLHLYKTNMEYKNNFKKVFVNILTDKMIKNDNNVETNQESDESNFAIEQYDNFLFILVYNTLKCFLYNSQEKSSLEFKETQRLPCTSSASQVQFDDTTNKMSIVSNNIHVHDSDIDACVLPFEEYLLNIANTNLYEILYYEFECNCDENILSFSLLKDVILKKSQYESVFSSTFTDVVNRRYECELKSAEESYLREIVALNNSIFKLKSLKNLILIEDNHFNNRVVSKLPRQLANVQVNCAVLNEHIGCVKDINCESDYVKKLINRYGLTCLYSSSECKKLLMQIFESAFGIWILEMTERMKGSNMIASLQKLKTLILVNSVNNWENLNKASSIIKILQTLLKVAEIANDNTTKSDRKQVKDVKKCRVTSNNDLLNISQDSDADFHSANLSCGQLESDVEPSETETDDFYLTADEGYEADGEAQEISDSEDTYTDLLQPLTPSSHFKLNVVHEGITKIVVEILMALSSKCVQNKNFWSMKLMELATRLFLIRDLLGGSLYLIQGFAPVLKEKDFGLREFQQSILDLITDFNKPEILSAYFEIISSDDPPIDLLATFMSNICLNSLRIQPTSEVEFPVDHDGELYPFNDPNLFDSIKILFDYHKHLGVNSPITSSAILVPLNHLKFKVWKEKHFTLSTWVQINEWPSQSKHSSNSGSAKSEDCLKTHLVSVGSNAFLISFFITDDLSLIVETSKPNEEVYSKLNLRHSISTSDVHQSEKSSHDEPTTSGTWSKKRKLWKNPVPIHENPLPSSTQTSRPHEKSSLANAFECTRMALRSSFSQFHLFSSSKNREKNTEGSCIKFSNIRFPKKKWTHICLSVEVKSNFIHVTITLDATDQYSSKVPYSKHDLSKMDIVQMLLLGATNEYSGESSEIKNFIKYSLSSTMLFRNSFTDVGLIANLTSLGPDCSNLTSCQMGNSLPNYGLIKSAKVFSITIDDFSNCLKQLRSSLIVAYTPHDHQTAIDYTNTEEGTNIGTRQGLILAGKRVKPNKISSIQTAVYLSGGLSSLLYFFARVVELTSDSNVQAAALDLLFSVAHSDVILYTEFMKNNSLEMIGSVIRADQCAKDVRLLKSIINHACNMTVISKKGDLVQVLENTNACIIYPDMIVYVIKKYCDWIKFNAKESFVLDMYLASIQALVREKHPFQNYNLMQLFKSGFVNELLNFCKIYVIEAPNPIFISTQSAESFVSLINTFAGAPPSASLLDELMKLLLLLHKPSDCYITHDRSKFYFLVKSDFSSKTKKINLSLPTRNFRRIIYERNKTEISSSSSLKSDSTTTSQLSSQNSESNKSLPKSSKFSETIKSLESITDCSKIDKKMIGLLDPLEATKLQKSLTNYRTRRKANYREPSIKTRKIYRKRLRTFPRMSTESDTERKCNKDKRVSSVPDEISILAAQEYDIVNVEEVSSLRGSILINKRKIKNLSKVKCWFSPGVVKIQEGLFTLLKNFLLILPDKAAHEVLSHYVKLEIILVLANHQNCSVRTAIIKLLSVICERLPSSELCIAYKKMYWYHLANQISLHPVDSEFVKECISWITGLHLDFGQIMLQDELRVMNPICINTLIAVLPQTILNEELTVNTLRIIHKMYTKDPKQITHFIEVGLIQALVKLLLKCAERLKGNVNHVFNEISSLLFTIGYNSISSTGHMNILWDILNLLTFCQEHKNIAVTQAFRIVQATVLSDLLCRFVPFARNSNEMKNIKEKLTSMYLHNSGLSNWEVRTRFDLLVDRSIQFTMYYTQSYKLSKQEVDLFETLISYGLYGIQKCCNVINWGLTPTQPIELKVFIIDNLWKLSRYEKLAQIPCDGKMMTTLLWSCLNNERENLPQKSIDQLNIVFTKFRINSVTAFDLDVVKDKLEMLRENSAKDQKSLIEKSVLRFETIAHTCIDSSMSITRIVTELQNAERKFLIAQMRQNDRCSIQHQWLSIIRRVSHEGAVWYNPRGYPSSWKLDDTEGPCRVRNRLQRCELNIEEKYFLKDVRKEPNKNWPPLNFLISSFDQQSSVCVNSQILFNFSAKHVHAGGEIMGELIITEKKIIFIATHCYKLYVVDCDIHNITEIWMRKYQHKENAFEIFMDNNKSLFFVLQRDEDRKTLKEVFSDKILLCADQSKLSIITQQWREGQLSNWEYLMALNQISGRTYNDLMQYPVLPWILSNYESQILDLTDEKNFRKFNKPIAVQDDKNEIHFIKNYEQTENNFGCKMLKPYHYSSHYSNSGIVLHFLVRVPPFTKYFIKYQDNKFDMPDRTFHCLKTTWSLASKESSTDLKELVPEFFSLPEMFENFEGFNFGKRQCGALVNHVELPPWCENDPRLFVLIHRQALESEVVRKQIHNWIDLIFGYKQTGIHAVEAINVFHPATYPEFSTSGITDPIEKKALETMIKTYGQMPKQLLSFPHPVSNDLQYQISQMPVINTVKGLRWGVFTGSPQQPDPRVCHIYKPLETNFSRLISFSNTNVVYGIPEHTSVVRGATVDTYNLICWNYDDRIVRIKSLSDDESQTKPLLYNNPLDEIVCCGSDPNSSTLWFGHKSGRITVYQSSTYDLTKTNKSRTMSSSSKMSYNSAFRKISMKISVNIDEYDIINDPKNNNVENRLQNWVGPIILLRHTDEITGIKLSTEFKISVSVGKDGLTVVWDLNSFSYIRTINHPLEIKRSPISLLDVSPTLGDILTVHAIKNQNSESSNSDEEEGFEVTEENLDDFVNICINLNGISLIRLHTINGKYIKHCVIDEEILAVCYTFVKEGSGVNVIATGHECGIVRLWSSWDLSLVKELKIDGTDIMSICFSTYQHLVILLRDNYIQVWESEGLCGSPPKFPQIVFQKTN